MLTKKQQTERAEALELIREALAACGPDGNATLFITDDGGRPSSTGRTHRLTVQVIRPTHSGDASARPESIRPMIQDWLTYNVARACGYRRAKDDSILMGGYGYSRPQEIASMLAHLVGHPLFVQSTGAGMGDMRGEWVKP